MNVASFIGGAAELIACTPPSCATINKEVMMTQGTKLAATLALATSLGIGSLGLATSTQAAGFTFSFGSGVTHNGMELRFRNGHFDNNYCLSNGEVRAQLRAHGFRSVQIIRNLGRHTVLAVGRKGSHWYQLVVNSCTGAVDQRLVRRSSTGQFSFTLSFGGRGDGWDDGYPNGDGGYPGHGDNGGPGNGGPGDGGNHEKLVCYVTFFDASQVSAGADANVDRAQVMPLSRAQAIDRPNDRSAIFDYGSDQQNISTCNYLDHLN